MTRLAKLIQLKGKIFGAWTVLEREPKYVPRRYSWYCRCVCGVERYVSGNDLRNGYSKSCGCLSRTKHGGRYLSEHNTWAGLKDRCLNPKSACYHRYGGRGIKVDPRWIKSFASFLRDVGRKPSSKHTLDRINVHGNYEPGNVRWATPFEQGQNRQNSRRFRYQGKSWTVGEWSRETGIPYQRLYVRLTALGWSIGRAVTTK